MVEVDYSGGEATAFRDLSLFSFFQNHQMVLILLIWQVFIWFNYSLLLVGSLSASTFASCKLQVASTNLQHINARSIFKASKQVHFC